MEIEVEAVHENNWQNLYNEEDGHWEDLRRMNRLWVPIILLLFLSTLAVIGYIYLRSETFIEEASSWSLYIIFLTLLAPILIFLVGYLLLNFSCTRFIRAFYRPSTNTRISALVRRRLTGIPPLPFILNTFFRYPTITIEEPNSLETDHWARWAGGPARLVIHDGMAVYLERGNLFSRVVGPGSTPPPFLERYETIKAVVDLRPQVRDGKISPWTKDGIQVELGVRMECQINASDESRENSNNLVYPFDALEVQRAVEFTAVKEKSVDDQKVFVESDWLDRVWGQVEIYLTRHINENHIDEIALAILKDIGPTKGNLYTLDLAEQHINEINDRLADPNCGAHVANLHIQIKFPDEVDRHRIAFWESRREILAAMRDGQAEGDRIRIREKARAKADNDILNIITDRLRKAGSENYTDILLISLTGILENLDDPIIRSLIAKNSLSLLENLRNLLKNF